MPRKAVVPATSGPALKKPSLNHNCIPGQDRDIESRTVTELALCRPANEGDGGRCRAPRETATDSHRLTNVDAALIGIAPRLFYLA
ncbi:MAG: hypothetical protein COA65_01995 [Rhodospirillaceae bacterium]|nr:MAG: hypothetical protein COA65_01995 [Rhodospirillaceae bacterium]